MAVYDIIGTNIDETGGASSGINYDDICKSVSHRGLNASAPENTIPAFKLARQAGFLYVETDVRFTSDNVAVCLHDESINRTARNSDGTAISETVNIADITYETALTYDFGIWKSATYAGTKIPTLEEFTLLCRNIGIHPYIELKTGTQAQIEGVVDTVKRYGLKNQTTYISFEGSRLTYVRDYDDAARLGLLDMGTPSAVNTANGLLTGTNDVFLDSSNKTRASECIAKNIGYEVWTVDNQDTIRGLDPYVSGVTMNSFQNAGKLIYDANIE